MSTAPPAEHQAMALVSWLDAMRMLYVAPSRAGVPAAADLRGRQGGHLHAGDESQSGQGQVHPSNRDAGAVLAKEPTGSGAVRDVPTDETGRQDHCG